MVICMAGIDFNRAALEKREAFAFTKSQASAGMQELYQYPGIDGCILYSTCNRTELWLCTEHADSDPIGLLCSLKKLPRAKFSNLMTQRNGTDAIQHLFETACGLKSRIWGEDQIITQIKDALQLALEAGTAGKILTKLFQLAITSAKKIKTEVRFSSGSSSVAKATVEKCRELLGGSIAGLHCLVIGSGDMGRKAAREMAASGASVCMTFRRYKYGISEIPDGCSGISYDDRVQELPRADIIISATASPHRTLHFEQVAGPCEEHPKRRIFIDLAVPRDLEPQIAQLPSCTLLTIDDIPCRVRWEEKKTVELQCRKIIDRYIQEFEKQMVAWTSLPLIQELSENFAQSFENRLLKELDPLQLPSKRQQTLKLFARQFAQEKVRKVLFSFRDWMVENDNGLPLQKRTQMPESEAEEIS
ncbi:MAG: hypothetical protein ACFWUC_00730 [Oscillospiraceae bacterium]|jgi:glutamyl-tRNA reductase